MCVCVCVCVQPDTACHWVVPNLSFRISTACICPQKAAKKVRIRGRSLPLQELGHWLRTFSFRLLPSRCKCRSHTVADRTGPDRSASRGNAMPTTALFGALHYAVKKCVSPASEWLHIAQIDDAVKGGPFWLCSLVQNFISIHGS